MPAAHGVQGCSTQSTAPLRLPLAGNVGLSSLGGRLAQSLCRAGLGLTWGRKAAKVEVFKRNSMSFGICGRSTVTARQRSAALGQDQPLVHLVRAARTSQPLLCAQRSSMGKCGGEHGAEEPCESASR